MPLPPTDTALWVRSSSTINAAALASVDNQVSAQLGEIETWPETPAKGLMRDVLQRYQSGLKKLTLCALRNVRVANVVLEMFGTGGQPDPPQPPILWSTGSW